MNNKRIYTWLIALILVINLTACNLPFHIEAVTPDVNATVAAEVALAQIVETRVAQTMVAGNSSSPSINTATNTLEAQPLVTSTPSLTPTTTFTPTPEGIFLSVSKDTNCRTGGSYTSFPIAMTVKAGQVVEVVSRNPENNSYIIINPDDITTTCWLWGQYATLTGNSASLPVSTMHPTPAPTLTPTPTNSFSLSYVGLQNCGLNYTFKMLISNTGNLTWQYIQISTNDATTAFSTNHASNNFEDYSGCALGLSQGDLTPGESSFVFNYNPGELGYDPTGHSIVISVKLCSEDNAHGTCLTKSLTFIP